MLSRKATVAAAVGLHARPAAFFVRAVTQTGMPVLLSKPGGPAVDARSLLEVMTADFNCGAEVILTVDERGRDPHAVDAALDHLTALLASDLTGTNTAADGGS
ncbi:HPr family phosphocarrier protein [Paenarthrobacter sp. Z7-10]|uniref:HPr family phosphocarrier protein n=1 Tax=Paenarthrobacter sp. Z7-10 TaxID=2787635 RepID=UPI0022A9A907|nr:HPr family phosphocarrier protein [Paenarthrobacter sp. Z7-10]MCZ2404310.1 HPr family phosphocarrier protein [Paenarthrobacter sp. Z7-10]